jgi:hypothetical protein
MTQLASFSPSIELAEIRFPSEPRTFFYDYGESLLEQWEIKLGAFSGFLLTGTFKENGRQPIPFPQQRKFP